MKKNNVLVVRSEKGPKSDVGHYCAANGTVYRFKTIERAREAIHPRDRTTGIWFPVRRGPSGWVRVS